MIDERLIKTGRVAHDIGLALGLGGQVFGKFAMNPAVAKVSRKRERGEVANRAWMGYSPFGLGGLAAVALGWLAARSTEANPVRQSPRERRLSTAKDGLVAAAVAAGVANNVQGARFARQARNGAVPIESGTKPAFGRTRGQAKGIQRSIGVLGNLNIALNTALVAVNALLAQENYSRPPVRRALLRRSR